MSSGLSWWPKCTKKKKKKKKKKCSLFIQKSICRSRSNDKIKSIHTSSRILASDPYLWLSYYKILLIYYLIWAFPGGSVVKNPPANAGDEGSTSQGSGRSPGEGNGNPLRYSYLGKSIDREAWGAAVWGCQGVRHDLATKQRYYLLYDSSTNHAIKL